MRRDWLAFLLVVIAGGVLAMTGWWRGSSSGTQIRVPMFYDAHYLFQRAWTQEQSVPDRPNPAPLLLTPNNQISQTWRNATDELSAVRVWVDANDQTLAWSIEADETIYRGEQIFDTPFSGYLTLTLPETLREMQSKTVTLRLQVPPSESETAIILRTVNGNRLWGEFRLNEFIQPANLDLHALTTGRYFGFVDAIGEQVIPAVFQIRLQQYKPDFLKGSVFTTLLLVVVAGTGAVLLWTLPVKQGRIWVLTAGIVLFFGWQIGSGRLLFAPFLERNRPIASNPLPSVDISAERLHTDFATTLYTAIREPEPRFVSLGNTPIPHIGVPANGRLQYPLVIPFDARLRSGFLPDEQGATIYVGDTSLDEQYYLGDGWYDLSQWGGQPQTIHFASTQSGLWFAPQLYAQTEFVQVDEDQEARFQFGETIELIDAVILENGIELLWRVIEQTTAYPIVFVHVLDSNNNIITQHDGAPVFGTYPVAVWQPNTIIRDFHPLTLPSDGSFKIGVGLYNPTTLETYPATNVDGVLQPDNRAIFE